jgi:glycosyltransferase involved in cell wall biosynthesis
MADDAISIAMTTFNGQRHIVEQLASLAAQTGKPFELVICDDGSTDATYGMLQSFARHAPFQVRLFQNEQRLGYRLNFMRAASLCQGSLVAFCDQNDIWHEDKVRTLVAHFATSADLTVSHDFEVFFDDERAGIASYFQYLQQSGLRRAHNIKGCSLAFRQELIAKFGWPDPRSKVSHDVWVCLIAALIERRGYLSNALLRYRIHANNTSGLVRGGDNPVAWFLRRLPLPPFTSRDERDVMLGFLIPDLLPDHQYQYVHEFLSSTRCDLSSRQREYALVGLERNRAIRQLITSESYRRPIARIGRALSLFLQMAYRNGGGAQGLAVDILGRRV